MRTAFSLLVSLVAVAGCDRHTAMLLLSGRVVDPLGQPVPGAKVRLETSTLVGRQAEQGTYETENDGSFQTSLISQPTWNRKDEMRLSVSKDGYRTVQEKLPFGGDSKGRTITLTPIDRDPSTADPRFAPSGRSGDRY